MIVVYNSQLKARIHGELLEPLAGETARDNKILKYEDVD